MTEHTPQKPDWAKTEKDLRRERGEAPSKWRWLIWVVVIAVLVGAGIALMPSQPDETANNEAEVAKLDTKFLAPEEVMTLEAKTVRHVVKVNGSVQPLTVASVPALISAQVEVVTRRAGDAVQRGDLLVSMDTESLDIQKAQQLAALQASEAQLALAESQLKRTQEMAQQGIAPSSQLEQADSSVAAQKANVESQKAAIRAIDYQLKNANIFSPLSGLVAARQTEPGQFVGAGSPLMEVVDLSIMELAANVSTKDSAQIRVGMTVTLRIEGLPGQSFTGTVQRISPVAARGTRTMPVFITIQNPDRALRGGMFATGQITLEEQPNTLTVPQTAIHQNDDASPFVLVVKDNRVVAQPITLGQTWGQDEALEVTSGLTAGDQIVVLPLPGLNAGDAISLIEG